MSFHVMENDVFWSLVQTSLCVTRFFDVTQEISLAYRRQCLRGHPSRGGSARNYLKLQAHCSHQGFAEVCVFFYHTKLNKYSNQPPICWVLKDGVRVCVLLLKCSQVSG